MEVLSSRVLLRPVDPERSHRFYGQTLGLPVYREFEGGVVYFLGGGFLEVSGRSSHGAGPNLSLWLQVRDLAQTFAAAVASEVEVLAEPERKPWGLLEAWIADPDGVRICLVEVPDDHPLRRDTRT
jgi:predicted enzyme related to lactoylglutathione lyase